MPAGGCLAWAGVGSSAAWPPRCMARAAAFAVGMAVSACRMAGVCAGTSLMVGSGGEGVAAAQGAAGDAPATLCWPVNACWRPNRGAGAGNPCKTAPAALGAAAGAPPPTFWPVVACWGPSKMGTCVGIRCKSAPAALGAVAGGPVTACWPVVAISGPSTVGASAGSLCKEAALGMAADSRPAAAVWELTGTGRAGGDKTGATLDWRLSGLCLLTD